MCPESSSEVPSEAPGSEQAAGRSAGPALPSSGAPAPPGRPARPAPRPPPAPPSLENRRELRQDSPKLQVRQPQLAGAPSAVRQPPARSYSSPRLPLAPAQLRRCAWRRHVLIHTIPGVERAREPKEEPKELPPRGSLRQAVPGAAPPCSRQEKPQLASPRRVALSAQCLCHVRTSARRASPEPWRTVRAAGLLST